MRTISPSSSATRNIGEGIPANAYGDSDADAVTALLIDQLGYRKENIIDLRDASLADLERVFGSVQNPGGEIAKRIDKQDPGDVFIYVASHGMVKEEDTKQVYLLPVDAKLDQLDTTAYPLQELYDNLGKTGARTTMLVLEANFAKNLDELIDPPNLPELDVEAMPLAPVPGLAVFKASDRDQRAIQDPEYGIGLFTRYLIEGFAGRADEAPLGNGDRRIDTVELYVYTADTVRTAGAQILRAGAEADAVEDRQSRCRQPCRELIWRDPRAGPTCPCRRRPRAYPSGFRRNTRRRRSRLRICRCHP